jgi:hypothetical protein
VNLPRKKRKKKRKKKEKKKPSSFGYFSYFILLLSWPIVGSLFSPASNRWSLIPLPPPSRLTNLPPSPSPWKFHKGPTKWSFISLITPTTHQVAYTLLPPALLTNKLPIIIPIVTPPTPLHQNTLSSLLPIIRNPTFTKDRFTICLFLHRQS